MLYRPVRQKSLTDTIQDAGRSVAALLSASSSWSARGYCQTGQRFAEGQLVAARTQEMNASSSEERVYFCYMHSIYMALSEVIIVGAY